MIIVLKKKKVFLTAMILLLAVVGLAVGCAFINKPKTASLTQKVIVIDAGHGGSDKGVVGQNGTEESKKNLEIAKKLRSVLEDGGFYVVMTRTTDGGADVPAGGFKQDDFNNRKKTIQNSSPDMVVSIHCNKFPLRDRRGIQVFYNPISNPGKAFASSLQNSLNELNSARTGRTYTELGGEYYMLNCTDAPSAIIECGFLSNVEDEKLLNDEKYLDELVFAIYEGIVSYMEEREAHYTLK